MLPIPVPSLKRKQINKVNFPRFIPEIDVTDPRSWFWKEGIQQPMIFVPLWQLLINKDILSKALSKGLHDFLDFDRKVLLSTVMPDELIDKLGIEDYFRLIEDLKPDATMIPDNYTYTDVPLYQSCSQTIKLISFANEFLKLDVPSIGLVKGANALQMDWAIRKQVEMGYVSFVMPARELLEEKILDDFLSDALMSLKFISKKIKTSFELLLYGVGHRLKHKGVSYSSLSWFIEAKRSHYFKNGYLYELVDPRIRFEECGCEACKGIMPQELFESWIDDDAYVKVLAIHNLLDLGRSL